MTFKLHAANQLVVPAFLLIADCSYLINTGFGMSRNGYSIPFKASCSIFEYTCSTCDGMRHGYI